MNVLLFISTCFILSIKAICFQHSVVNIEDWLKNLGKVLEPWGEVKPDGDLFGRGTNSYYIQLPTNLMVLSKQKCLKLGGSFPSFSSSQDIEALNAAALKFLNKNKLILFWSHRLVFHMTKRVVWSYQEDPFID